MKRFMYVICLSSLFFSSCVYTRPVTVSDYRHITGWSYLGIVIPGLTQVMNGEYLKGGIFFATYVAAGALMASAPDLNKTPLNGSLYTAPAAISMVWSMIDGIGTTSRYIQQRKEIDFDNLILPPAEKQAIKAKTIFIGMSARGVVESLGKPYKVNSMTGQWGVYEQWVYYGDKYRYVYIENGVVKSWSN